MRYKKDPRQAPLFDPFATVFSDVAYRRVRSGWWELFRRCILELMPVDAVEKRFSASLGRRTKELYSVAGLLLIKEFMDWTEEEAVDAYLFHAEIQYALNLEPAMQSFSVRSLQRYEKIFRDDDLAAQVMHDVTVRLIELLDQDVSRQRLDSTHFHSDMATFGRTRLMGVAIKRFLTQVRRHGPKEYEALPEEFRSRYRPSTGRLFADVAKDGRAMLRQQVAEDLHWLIERFADHEKFAGRSTYKALLRIFDDQCEVAEEAIVVKKKTGGDVVQNPSDPDATYDGKKGPGYQVQICETCSDENEVQLITAAKVETAVESDQRAVVPILEDLAAKDALPARLEADGGYGSDANVCAAAGAGVDLQSPTAVSGSDKRDIHALGIDDFDVDPDTERVQCCPVGHRPTSSVHDPETGVTTTIMPAEACGGCQFGGECPIKRVVGTFQLRHTPEERRLHERRREQDTEAFRDAYRKRSGGESTNSGLKRRTGLGRLRVRGRAAVAHAVYMRVAGWNILRAAASSAVRAKLAAMNATAAAAALPALAERASRGRAVTDARIRILAVHRGRRVRPLRRAA